MKYLEEQDQLVDEGHDTGFSSSHLLLQFYVGIGVLVQQGLIDVNLVKNLLSQRIIWYWDTFGDTLIREREDLQDPSRHESLEYHYHEMKKYEQQRGTIST